MISIDRDRGFIFLHRADYLYRDGLENRDENAAREMGDGDICIPLPEYMKDRWFDCDGVSDGQDAVTIIEEIIRRISGPENTEIARPHSGSGASNVLPPAKQQNS